MSNDRIASFLNAAGGNVLGLSEGSVYYFCRTFSQKAQESATHLEEEILNQRVVMTDAAVMAMNGEMCYIRNFSVEKAVVYRAMKDKTLEGMKKLRFLAKFAGILVHNHETSLYHFGTGHGECIVHIIRYLKKNSEDSGNGWSGKMTPLLCEMNRARKQLIGEGRGAFPEEVILGYEEKYREMIARDGRRTGKPGINMPVTMGKRC